MHFLCLFVCLTIQKRYNEAQRQNSGRSGDTSADPAVEAVNRVILEMLPQVKEAKRLCRMLDRGMLTFEARLHKSFLDKVRLRFSSRCVMGDVGVW